MATWASTFLILILPSNAEIASTNSILASTHEFSAPSRREVA